MDLDYKTVEQYLHEHIPIVFPACFEYNIGIHKASIHSYSNEASFA